MTSWKSEARALGTSCVGQVQPCEGPGHAIPHALHAPRPVLEGGSVGGGEGGGLEPKNYESKWPKEVYPSFHCFPFPNNFVRVAGSLGGGGPKPEKILHSRPVPLPCEVHSCSHWFLPTHTRGVGVVGVGVEGEQDHALVPPLLAHVVRKHCLKTLARHNTAGAPVRTHDAVTPTPANTLQMARRQAGTGREDSSSGQQWKKTWWTCSKSWRLGAFLRSAHRQMGALCSSGRDSVLNGG